MDLLIIILIFWWIYKKYSKNSTTTSPQNISKILEQNGFHSISTISQNQESQFLSAILNGDNYLIAVMKGTANVYNSTVETLVSYAKKIHYHNVILIAPRAAISNSAKALLFENKIEVWDYAKLLKFSAPNSQNQPEIIKTSEIHDTCKIDTPEDPIQDGSKVNSLFGNLFGKNKIERL